MWQAQVIPGQFVERLSNASQNPALLVNWNNIDKWLHELNVIRRSSSLASNKFKWIETNSNIIIIDADLFVCIEFIKLSILGEWELNGNWDIKSVCTRDAERMKISIAYFAFVHQFWEWMFTKLIKLLWFP